MRSADDDAVSLTTEGEHELLKAGVHLTALALVVAMCGYNLRCLFTRPSPSWRHALNVGVYGLAIPFELHHVYHHVKKLTL